MSLRLWLRSLFWRKTIDDLVADMNAGKRRMIHRDEIELANAYTRRRLPKDVLPKGERVRVYKPTDERPISVYCDPLRYDALHEMIVSEEERAEPRYSGYYFWLETVTLNRSFRLVGEAPDS